VVTVEDHGIGIPAKDLDRSFERDYCASNVSGIGGTGVGLYLVKMVVDLHGGTISVNSKEGEGILVTVRLPIKPPSQVGAIAPAEATPDPALEEQRVEDHADR